MKHYVTKHFEFAAAHRLQDHPGKCHYLHGHTYAIEVVLGSESLDSAGMVEDFRTVKASVGKWIDAEWDHATILQTTDPLVGLLRGAGQKVRVLEGAPTAECMAEHLYAVAREELGAQVVAVRVWETPTSCAEYRL